MPSSQSGSWQKLVPIALLTFRPRYHGSHHEKRSEQNRMTLSAETEQVSQFTNFTAPQSESAISALTEAAMLHPAPECSSCRVCLGEGRGGGGVGCFGREHFLLFLSGAV